MTTYRELVYICLDLVKGTSDDFSYTEEHVAYLLDKYRALLLKQKYGNDPKKYIPLSNYNNLVIYIESDNTTGKSVNTVPNLMNIGIPRITEYKKDYDYIEIDDYYTYDIEFVSRERYPFVGKNRWLSNIMYCTIDTLGNLIIKKHESKTDITTIPKAICLTAIFEEPILGIESNKLDNVFPIEESLIPNLIQLVLKDLLGAAYRPSDNTNNASDDLAALAGYLSKALKQPYTNNLRPEDTEDK